MMTTATPATHLVDDRLRVVRQRAPRGRMTGLFWRIVWLSAAWWIARAIWRHRTRLIRIRALAVRSDVGGLHEGPGGRLSDVRVPGPHSDRLDLVSTNLIDRQSVERNAEGVSFVWASQPDPGVALLYDCQAPQSRGLVAPPATKSIRLGCLQNPMTYRRLDV
jgi:hypothetical protein